MKKSIHSPEYQHVLRKLVEMRKKAGMTQRDMAKKLEREHSFVWRIETGERRLDVVEFYWVCQALGCDASVVYEALVKELAETEAVMEMERIPLSKVAEIPTTYHVKRRKDPVTGATRGK